MTHTLTLNPNPFMNINIVIDKNSPIMKKIQHLAALYGAEPRNVQLVYTDEKQVIFAIRKNGTVLLVKKPAAWFYGNVKKLTAAVIR